MKIPRGREEMAHAATGILRRVDPASGALVKFFTKSLAQSREPSHADRTVRTMVASFLFPALSLTLSACGPRITNQNLDVVNRQRAALEKMGKGLSPKEVESILGQPTRTEAFKIPLETQKPMLDGVRYTYVQDGQEITLHFVDNKLISDVPELGGKPSVPPSK